MTEDKSYITPEGEVLELDDAWSARPGAGARHSRPPGAR